MKFPSKSEQKEIIAAVQKVYAELSSRQIHRDCKRLTECCQFHITGKIPHLTRCEAFVAARAFRATGRKTLPETDVCPMLDQRTGKCLIYEHRPFGCRTHFCAAAGGPYERREVSDLIHQLETIDARYFQSEKGGIPLPQAVRAFLE